MCFTLCGCARQEPGPEPTPEITEYTVSDESAEEILALAQIESLKTVDATASTEYAALLELYNARPDCQITWNYEFEGQLYLNTTTELKATQLEGLEDALRYLPALTDVDLLDTGATVEDMDRFDAIRPDIFYLWSFEHDGFTIRTDILCYSSLRANDMHYFTSEELYPLLKYCKKLRALDLGHNVMDDISLIGGLKDLQVLIIAENAPITDASCLANLENLLYLEIFLCQKIEDFSFLNDLTKMEHLNLCYCRNLTELDFLDNMPNLDTCFIKYTGVDSETYDSYREKYPELNLLRFDGDIQSCGSGWRETRRNHNIRTAFSAWRHVLDYPHPDSVIIDPDIYLY